MSPSTVNDSARALQGAVKRWYQHINCATTSTGSANAQVLTYSVAPSFATGDIFTFIAGFSNTNDTTLTVNGTSLGHILFQGAVLVGGEIVAGTAIMVSYDGANVQLLARSGGLVNPHFTAGSVTFAGASGQLAQDNANFFWDSTNHNLGLGGAAAANWRLGITGHGTTSATYGLVVDNSVGGGVLWARDDGVVSMPAYANGAVSMSGGSIVTGTLPVGNGGTGVTSATGTGSVVLSANPTLTGTTNVSGLVASNGIVSSAPGNQFGTPSGSTASPLRTNTNLLLYNNGATNWSGIGSDTGGTMYFVTGTSGTPSTRLTIDPSGTANFTGTVGGGSGWNVTTAGTGTFNGNMNIGGVYEVSGVQISAANLSNGTTGSGAVVLAANPTLGNINTSSIVATGNIAASGNINASATLTANVVNSNQYQLAANTLADRITNYTRLYDFNGNVGIHLGGGTDQSNYYRNTTHFIQSINGSALYATFNSTGLSVAGTVSTGQFSQSGNTFASGGGTIHYNGFSYGVVSNASGSYCVARDDGSCELGDNVAGQSAIFSGGTAFSFTSDRDLKENIRPYTEKSFLDLINKLKPMRFNMIADVKKRDQVGYIAQDVQEIFPHLVSEQQDGNLSLAYGGLIMPLVAAVQELAAENKSLKADIAAIKAKLGI